MTRMNIGRTCAVIFFICLNAHAVTLTGNVETDFTGASVMMLGDTPRRDVGMPSSLSSNVSGWDIADVRFMYDPVADEMAVGVNFKGIGGDADGDGNPGMHELGAGGFDVANLGGTESVCVRIDFDRDGRFDLIAGVPSGSDADNCIVAYSLNTDSPALYKDFGVPISDVEIRTSGAPTAERPDFEFVITRFSSIAGCYTEDFIAEAFAGSFEDGGIGEDFVHGSVFGLGVVPVDDAGGSGISFRVWAPFAKDVGVTGLLDRATIPLVREEGLDTWRVFVDGAQSVSGVCYVITGPNDEYLEKKDPRSRAVTHARGNSLVYESRAHNWSEGSNYMDSWNRWVIYQIHVGSFYGNGQFSNVTEKLDYIQGLGINAIELLPVMEFPGNFSGGYNPSDVFAVAHQYGGPDEFKKFIAECHRRNIAVIVDVVYNHFSPTERDLWKFDGWFEGRFGGIYFYQDDRADTAFGPRPDFGRPEVRAYIYDNIRMFICEYHVDGFRWDSTINVRRGNNGDIPDGRRILYEGNQIIHRLKSHAISIAEDLQDWPEITKPGGNYGFSSQWGSGFYWTLHNALINPNDSDRRVTEVAQKIGTRDHNDAFSRIIFTENHDEVWELNRKHRLPDAIHMGDPASYWARKRSTLGAAIVMTAPGIPMIFMGQERYATGQWRDGQVMDWSMDPTREKILQLYKDLIHLRRDMDGNSTGLIEHNVNVYRVDDEKKVIAYHRYHEGGAGDDVVVVANFSTQPLRDFRVGFPKAGRWDVRFNSDSLKYGDDYTDVGGLAYETEAQPYDNLADSAEIEVGPYSVLILTQGNIQRDRMMDSVQLREEHDIVGFESAEGATRTILFAVQRNPAAQGEDIIVAGAGVYSGTHRVERVIDVNSSRGENVSAYEIEVPWQGLPEGFGEDGSLPPSGSAKIVPWRETY